MSEGSKELQFAPGLLHRFVKEILREYPRKTFGYFLSENATDPRIISHFYVFTGDARSSRQVSDFFRQNGAYYENNPTAGFLATAQETATFERWRRRAGLVAVGVFHAHLRHPAHLAKIDQRLHPRADLFHLLISMRNPAQPELAAWRPSATGFMPCRIVECGVPCGGEDGHYFPSLPPRPQLTAPPFRPRSTLPEWEPFASRQRSLRMGCSRASFPATGMTRSSLTTL